MVRPWINGWHWRLKIKLQASTNLMNLNPARSKYSLLSREMWSSLVPIKTPLLPSAKPSGKTLCILPAAATELEGFWEENLSFCSQFPKQKPSKRGGKEVQTLKKNSLKVSVLAELKGNFLRKSRVVIVFCCLERISACVKWRISVAVKRQRKAMTRI